MQLHNTKGINLGTKLRQLRLKNELSQEYVAQTLRVSQKTYSNMENDKTTLSVETLKQIAQLYNIDMLELLQDGKVVVQNNNSNDTSTVHGIIYNHASDELIEQLKERINDLKEIITKKDEQILRLEGLLISK